MMDLVEIYLSYDVIDAELIKGLLEDHHIHCMTRDMRITPYPLSVGSFSEKRIAVEEGRVDDAMELIKEAIRDKYISSNGRFRENEHLL